MIEGEILQYEVDRLIDGMRFWHVKRRAAVVDLIKETTDAIWKDARSNAPVDEGDYKSEINRHLRQVTKDLVGEVAAENWKSHFIEFGTVNMRANPVLQTAWRKHAGPFVAKMVRIFS